VKTKAKFALALAILSLAVGTGVALLAVGVWSSVDPGEQAVLTRVLREQAALLATGGLLLLAGLGALVALFFKLYVAAPRRLATETRLIASANPDHRLEARGPGEVRELAVAVNELADRYRSARSDVEGQIAAARADLEQERNRLAALMSELTLAVLVCNVEGRILLYNAAARQLLDRPAGLVGLGRSVFGIVDRSLIAHALACVRDGSAASHLAMTARGDKLLQVQIAPVAAEGEALAGFVLTLEDMTRRAEISERRDALLRALTEGTRASLASIRAAVESMLDYPEMEPEQRRRFVEIIREEATGLGAQVERAMSESSGYLHDQWLLADMLDRDLLTALGRSLEGEAGVRASIDEPGDERWLRVDSFALVRAVTHLAGRLHAERGVDEIRLAVRGVGRHAELDLRWQGPPLDAETLRSWTEQPLGPGGTGAASTLEEVVERHGGELWSQADEAGRGAYVRLLLPLAEAPGLPAPSPVGLAVPDENRPEFYDFDLFGAAEDAPAWDERRLDELAYTVFDTETTGLSPSEGDEIISIGAIRIVNGRLLRQETFEQLVDPRRGVPAASQRVHGISPDLLRGQPTIEEVLPAFARFASDTVLVGHNVAFDMRFLQLKEDQTGVRLTQPVLDTLLLSAVVHPEHSEHSLEAMAARLGVSVIGRHTALGDAILTGEIFLKLLRLLVAQGVVTLRDAREAARRTYQARVSDSLYTRG
jgi:DNA polymerase-3 subunit epsilon